MAPRADVVEALVQAAFIGMGVVDGTSGDEILSACMTMAKRSIRMVMDANPDAAAELRNAVGELYLACLPTTPLPKDIQ